MLWAGLLNEAQTRVQVAHVRAAMLLIGILLHYVKVVSADLAALYCGIGELSLCAYDSVAAGIKH